MAPADAIGFKKELDRVIEAAAVECDGKALFKADGDFFAFDLDITDTRDKLISYAAAGLLTLSKGSEMPKLHGVTEKEK